MTSKTNLEKSWESVLKNLRLSLSPATFKTWFKNTTLLEIKEQENLFRIGCQNPYTKEWLEKRYKSELENSLKKKTGIPFKIDFIIINKEKKNHPPGPLFDSPKFDFKTPAQTPSTGFVPYYQFKNFIVGHSNNLAHAAALAVAEKPGFSHNPLFIYGGVGVGKTHLMHAIGNRALEKRKRLKTSYITSEKFTNDLIESFRKNNTEGFRKKYRQLDLLIIDDIQFISGKEAIQEEFFHTFNVLHSSSKQIIISSDRPPHELQKLESRLKSRFEGGLIIDIQPPDFETRVAILMAKCEEKKIHLSPESLNFIAENIVDNVRQLEGMLNQIITVSRFSGKEPNLELIKNLISKKQETKRERPLTPKKILEGVAAYYRISEIEIKGKKREARIVFPRQIIMYLLRKELNMQLEMIGKLLGNRDHTTIMHGVEKIENLSKKEDPHLKGELKKIKSVLREN